MTAAAEIERRPGPRPGLAAALVIAAALLVAVAVAVVIDAPPSERGSALSLSGLSLVVTIAAFSVVGGLVARRRPENPIGWLLATIGLLFALVVASSAVSLWVLKTGSLPRAVGEWASVPGNLWVIALGLIGTQLPLRVPDGALPSPRWRGFSRVSLVLIAVAFVGMVVHPGKIDSDSGAANPLGVPALSWLAGTLLLVIACFAGGLAGLVVRYRRSTGHDRAQLRWVALGGAVFLGVYLMTLVPVLVGLLPENGRLNTVLEFVSQVAFAAVPIAIGFAILRRGLYDIDVIVNRTLVYGVLTATLAAAYVGTVLLLQLVLSGATQGSQLSVAGSTLAVAGLFGPARSRIQALVDRRFFRRKYDAQRTLEAFAARLRDEVELDRLSGELRDVIAATMQPAHVSLWLREPGER